MTRIRTITRRSVIQTGAAALASAAIIGRASAQTPTGKLVVYSSLTPALQKRTADAFTAKTRIEVTSLRLNTAGLAQRFLSEQRAQQYLADIITLSSDVFYEDARKAGLLLPTLDGIPNINNIPATFRFGPDTFIMAAQGFSIAYNTNTVTGASIPKTWQDIVKPEFVGQLIMPDPRGDDTLVPFWVVMRQTFGDDFLKKIGALKPRLVAVTAEGVERLVAGEVKLVVPCNATTIVAFTEQKAPVAVTPIPSPTNSTYNYTAIAAKAPNMDSARKWVEYVCSREGQEVLCKDLLVSPLGDIPGSIKAPEKMITPDLRDSMRQKGEIFDLLGLPA